VCSGSSGQSVIDCDPFEFLKCLRPKLTFTQIVWLFGHAMELGYDRNKALDRIRLWDSPQRKNWQQTAEALLTAPIGFQVWTHEKACELGDLAPLLYLSNSFSDEVWSRWEITKQIFATKQTGLKWLELAIEVVGIWEASGKLEDLPVANSVGAEGDLEVLKDFRFRSSLKQETQTQAYLNSLSLPRGCRISLVREADQCKLKLQLEATTKTDFTASLSKLSIMSDKLGDVFETASAPCQTKESRP